MTTIDIQYRSDSAHMQDTLHAHLSVRLIRVLPWLLWALSATGLLLFATSLLSRMPMSAIDWIMPIPLVLAGLLGFYFTPKGMARQQKHIVPALLDQPVHWHITEDQLTHQIGDVSQSHLGWPSLHRVIRLPDGFLLYTTAINVIWLPDHVFTDASAIKQFAQWAARGVRSYINIRPNRIAEWAVSILLASVVVPVTLFFYRFLSDDSLAMNPVSLLLWHLSLFSIPGIVVNALVGLPIYLAAYRLGCRAWFCYAACGTVLGALIAFIVPHWFAPWIAIPRYETALLSFTILGFLHWLVAVRGSQPFRQHQ